MASELKRRIEILLRAIRERRVRIPAVVLNRASELEAALAAPVEGETELREQLARRMYECARTEPLWESASKSSRGFCYDYTDAIMPLLRPYLASAQQQAADAPRSQPKRRGSHSPNGGMCRFSQSNRSIR